MFTINTPHYPNRKILFIEKYSQAFSVMLIRFFPSLTARQKTLFRLIPNVAD